MEQSVPLECYNLIVSPRLSPSWEWLQNLQCSDFLPKLQLYYLSCLSASWTLSAWLSHSHLNSTYLSQTMLCLRKPREFAAPTSELTGKRTKPLRNSGRQWKSSIKMTKVTQIIGESCELLLNMWTLSFMRGSRCILERTYTYIISTGLHSLMPLILWVSLYVNMIVEFKKKKCVLYINGL